MARDNILETLQPENGWFYITWTRATRDKLRRRGFKNVQTINESEGQTLPRVRLLRPEEKLPDNLKYDSGQAVVALSRHTQQLEYITVEQDALNYDRVYEHIREADAIASIARAHGEYDTTCSRSQ
jgi:hypothetical protein